jgi:hypothetical protein
MADNVINGKAFEWAVSKAATEISDFKITVSPNSEQAKYYYESKIDNKKRSAFDRSALVCIRHIFEKENLFDIDTSSGLIRFNTDRSGEDGDVRDLVLELNDKNFGISCKSNNKDFKHSRFSHKLDFISKWGIDSRGCSKEYWDSVLPLFNELQEIRASSGGTALWKNMHNKPERFYWPFLNAWVEEIRRVSGASPEKGAEVCRNLILYIVGKYDFYKIINSRRQSLVQAFNFGKSLNTSKTKFPTLINSINDKNGSQYSKTITFNHGFSFNFRVKNGDSDVKPSLKFAVGAIGLPQSEVYQQTFDI